ncbi:MAG: Transcriptional regulator, GntR family domain / Aspartate aminotransferase [uncultured Nocardioidaceae bacterium]|uniref:Transcriptional regulator, GntR family domain / Aspartate aminotransferase n=1 Tax=uncultured Nocardioidaceae bacterium TaxID=253824 RepID=A0A6J4KY83_9ACTN|nr:MAG: Transcriptional regulator, GntR family domain / Aspartate aminotransferase [uncultured Nocardioidaceae bacterium]
MSRTIAASRVASLVGDLTTGGRPLYVELAEQLRLLIGEGRITAATRLPSERELTAALGVSRTTVTRAYAELRDRGYAESRRGSGTVTRLPLRAESVTDRVFAPWSEDPDVIDLNCAAPSAPAGVAAAYEAALAELPCYLSSHGYYPAGLPRLQAAVAATYEERGLPTSPDQVIITAGALAATAIVAQALTAPGDRVVVEDPVYPNATQALSHRSARLVPAPVDPHGWDVPATAAIIRQAAPQLAYLVPDFQNPTGSLMPDAERAELAAALRRARVVPVIDEAHQALALDGQPMPAPFAAHLAGTVTIGSASKQFWGGLRLGWLRVPEAMVPQLLRARMSLDLGAPLVEQLALVHLLEHRHEVWAANRVRLRGQRDALLDGLAEHLPEWEFVRPGGGLAVWCRLPSTRGAALVAEAERHGVVAAAGRVFAVEGGGLDQHVRIPWTRPVEELETAVRRLSAAWDSVAHQRPRDEEHGDRLTVA